MEQLQITLKVTTFVTLFFITLAGLIYAVAIQYNQYILGDVIPLSDMYPPIRYIFVIVGILSFLVALFMVRGSVELDYLHQFVHIALIIAIWECAAKWFFTRDQSFFPLVVAIIGTVLIHILHPLAMHHIYSDRDMVVEQIDVPEEMVLPIAMALMADLVDKGDITEEQAASKFAQPEIFTKYLSEKRKHEQSA